jgi:alkylated DNA repair dioxygenase AlkB
MASRSIALSVDGSEISEVPGLSGLQSYLDVEDERELLEFIDAQPWSNTLSRRTQHYGFVYDYKSRRVPEKTTPISGEILRVFNDLVEQGIYESTDAIQCIVNEYTRKQGISAHTDAPIFGAVICSISLGADTVMNYDHPDGRSVPVFLARRSLVVMEEDAREVWKHSIPQTTSYRNPDGIRVTKPEDYRRVSLTFRVVRNA